MRTRALSLVTIAMLSLLVTFSCKDKAKTVFIEPPFENLAPEFQRFTVDIAKGGILQIKSGTSIAIPPYALTDSRDLVATGVATILYREFRDEFDVFLSGIPTGIQDGGELRGLQTAGMFELRAMQGVIELGLARDKNIEVKFATEEGGADYSFFALNDSSGIWEFRDYSKPAPKLKKTTNVETIEDHQPASKTQVKPDYFLLKDSFIIDGYFGGHHHQVGKQVAEKKAAKFGLPTYQLYAGKVEYEGNKYPASSMVWESVSGHNFPEWARDKYCEVSKIKESVYQIKVAEEPGGSTFALNARLVMPLEDLFVFRQREGVYDDKKAALAMAVEEHQMTVEAAVFRTIQLAGFGIYNFDRLPKIDNTFKIQARFEMNEEIDNEIYQIKYVYRIPGYGKSVIKMDASEPMVLYLDSTDLNCRFLTVLPGGQIGIFAAWQYTHIDFKGLAAMENPSHTFIMKVQRRTINSADDLKYLLTLARND